MQKVYIVAELDYDLYDIDSVWTDKEAAEKRREFLNDKARQQRALCFVEPFRVDEEQLDPTSEWLKEETYYGVEETNTD